MRFEFIAGALCLDFANTLHNSLADDKGEELQDISDLLQWGTEASLLSRAEHARLAALFAGNPRDAAAALRDARAARDLLLSIFAGIAHGRPPSPQLLAQLNSALADLPAILQVRKSSHRIETAWESSAGGVQRILFAVLESAARLLAGERLGRLRECASDDCTWLFVDESRNRSRRWCDMSSCGNRMKARLHYRRSRAATR